MKKIIISRRISFPYAELLLRLYFTFFVKVTPKRAVFYCLQKEMQIKFLQHDIVFKAFGSFTKCHAI